MASDDLHAALLRQQRNSRAPSIACALLRGGEVVESGAVGHLDGRSGGPVADVDTVYRIGSITKTFVAAAVLQLAGEGQVDLDQPVAELLPELQEPLRNTSVRALLNHSSGLLAETDGSWWERSPGRTWDELRPSIRRNPDLIGRFHYSNVGYAVLGEVVARQRNSTWFEAIDQKILRPLGMDSTSATRPSHAAPGLAVHPYADLLHAEEVQQTQAMAPAGELWSTIGDLARWARFLARGDERVLPDRLLRLMRSPTVVDHNGPGSAWTRSYGLGLDVHVVEGATYVGHGGSMPGYLAAVRVDPETGDGFALLSNTTGGLDLDLGYDLPTTPVVKDSGRYNDQNPWVAGPPVPVELTGSWMWGPRPNILRFEGDLLLLAPVGGGRASRFESRGPNLWVGLDGYYAGENLTAGDNFLDVGSFRFTRTPYDPAGDVPGGVDSAGWH
ncbi:serine hydrolase domain-containing protein [Calidifontibacter terrae]